MRATNLKRSKRGFVRKIGPAMGAVKFYLGHDRDQAQQKLDGILVLWKAVEQRAAAQGVQPAWDEESKAAAKAIERGEPAKIAKGDYEMPERYFERVSAMKNSGLPIEPEEPFIFEVGRADIVDQIANAQTRLASATASPKATGQQLHDALRAYQDHVRREYKEGDHMTDNGKSKVDLVTAMMNYLPNVDLGTLDYSGCDEIFGVFRRRPVSKRSKKTMARKSCINLIGELGRFFTWLHTSTTWAWRRPEDFSYIKRTVRETDEDREKEADDIPVWTVGELAIISEYAGPLERVFFLLGLNCAYGADQSGRLRLRHLRPSTDEPTHINRVRHKKKVRAIHLLWPQTLQAVKWAIERRKRKKCVADFLLVTSTGTPYWRKTKGGNQSSDIPRLWRVLLDRIRKDHPTFRWLPFNSLRDTSTDMIRQIAGEETASVHAAHKHQSKDENLKSYSNPVRRRHFKALRRLEKQLFPVFAAAGAEPFTPPARNLIGLEKVKQIKALHEQGTPISEIARQVGVSQNTVNRHIRMPVA